MITSLLLAAQPRLQPVFTISLPSGISINGTDMDPSSENLVFDRMDGKTMAQSVCLLSFRRRKVLELGPGRLAEARDCGAGLVSVLSRQGQTETTSLYRFADGKLVSKVKGRLRRIGSVFQESRFAPDVFDLHGKLIVASPKPSSGPQPQSIGQLAWVGKRRLAIVGHGDVFGDRNDLVELSPEWRKGKRVPLFDNAMAFDGIVGNPDKGPFAVMVASNRWRYAAGIFTKDLRRLWPMGFDQAIEVTDVGPRGVLAYRLKQIPSGAEHAGSLCLDPESGKTLWRGTESGTWLGRYVLTESGHLLDGGTGKPAGKLALPSAGRIVARSSDLLYVIQGQKKLTAFRITGL